MQEVLLTSEGFVKSTCGINDNVSAKYVQSAIREAQETKVQEILGTPLFKDLKRAIAEGEMTTIYTELAERCQYFLAYQSTANLLMKVAYKVTNAGVVKTTGDNLTSATQTEVAYTRDYYVAQADHYAMQLQMWLRENRNSLPLLTERAINQINSNLHSAASCGVFLGGARGKRIRR